MVTAIFIFINTINPQANKICFYFEEFSDIIITIMIEENLDKLKNSIENTTLGTENVGPEILASKETEKSQTEKAPENKSILEKSVNKLKLSKAKKVAPPIPQVQDEISIKIEKILESGLAQEYAKLSPIAKQEFKIKGEETTAKIREILQSTHIKVKQIFYLIIEWLRILPGINKFFLEQEAKIKTDAIIELHKKQKTKDLNKIL